MMYMEESLGPLDVSKLANVPRWTHPFKVETPPAGLPSPGLRSALIGSIKVRNKAELAAIEAERMQQEQDELDLMAAQMSSADFGSRSARDPPPRSVPKTPVKSDASIAEEKKKAEQQKRIDEEQEMEAKKARLAELEGSLKEAEAKLEVLNNDKHDLFVQFRYVKQVEDMQRMRELEEKRRVEEEIARRTMTTPSPSPISASVSPLPPSYGNSPLPPSYGNSPLPPMISGSAPPMHSPTFVSTPHSRDTEQHHGQHHPSQAGINSSAGGGSTSGHSSNSSQMSSYGSNFNYYPDRPRTSSGYRGGSSDYRGGHHSSEVAENPRKRNYSQFNNEYSDRGRGGHSYRGNHSSNYSEDRDSRRPNDRESGSSNYNNPSGGNNYNRQY